MPMGTLVMSNVGVSNIYSDLSFTIMWSSTMSSQTTIEPRLPTSICNYSVPSHLTSSMGRPEEELLNTVGISQGLHRISRI